MVVTAVVLFGLGQQNGETTVITGKLLTNIYTETRPQGEKSQLVGLGFPGYDLFGSYGASPSRGEFVVEQRDRLYAVFRAVVKEINNAGVSTDVGLLNTSTGSVMMAHNGVQLMIVDGTNGYIYNTLTTVFAQITDIDFPANPTSVTFQDGYFIAGFDDGKFYISALYDGLSWDALDFTTANSVAGPLVRIFSDHGELIAFQDLGTSFYGNTGFADFPFSKIQGADAEWGLAARYSACKFDDSVAFLCKNRMGGVIVGKLAGHSLQKLSTPDLDKRLQAYAVTSDAVAFSELLGGHPMYQINFPSAGESWLFDGSTGIWTKRKSFGIERQRCERGTPFLGSLIMSDYANGSLYRRNPTALTENGSSIEGEIIGEHWDRELQYLDVKKIRLDMEVGTMEFQGGVTSWDLGATDWDLGLTIWDYIQPYGPTVMLQVSRDDGKTYGSEMWKSMGKLGQYQEVVEWRRLGSTRRLTAKFRIVDPVRRVITGVYLNPSS